MNITDIPHTELETILNLWRCLLETILNLWRCLPPSFCECVVESYRQLQLRRQESLTATEVR
jgi:midasin (ATPase involved in ribosome maturation)